MGRKRTSTAAVALVHLATRNCGKGQGGTKEELGHEREREEKGRERGRRQRKKGQEERKRDIEEWKKREG